MYFLNYFQIVFFAATTDLSLFDLTFLSMKFIEEILEIFPFLISTIKSRFKSSIFLTLVSISTKLCPIDENNFLIVFKSFSKLDLIKVPFLLIRLSS